MHSHFLQPEEVVSAKGGERERVAEQLDAGDGLAQPHGPEDDETRVARRAEHLEHDAACALDDEEGRHIDTEAEARRKRKVHRVCDWDGPRASAQDVRQLKQRRAASETSAASMIISPSAVS